ncbi:MAG: hypothetical protein ACHQHN_14960 [Sphingobacteriales bacterium]
MNSPKILKITLWITVVLLLVLFFEWPNIETQYKGATLIETSISIDNTLTNAQKHMQLAEVQKVEEELKGDVLIVKYLLVIVTIIFFIILGRFIKLKAAPIKN